MFDIATLALVGQEATLRILGESWGTEHDEAQALAIARAINQTAAEVNAWLYFARGRAETIVAKNEAVIQRLADALSVHGRLAEAEIRAIVDR
jgi:hypothetical protein